MAGRDAPGSPAWWRRWHGAPGGSRRRRDDGLSRDGVLVAALAVVDAEGLEALTMRRLARELGTAHASLYRHVASRDELLVLVVDRVLGEVRVDDLAELAGLSPRGRAEALLHRYRRVLLAHPALAPLLVGGQLLGPNALAAREVGLDLLLAAGAPPGLAAEAYLTLTHFVIGSAVFEAGGAARTAADRREMAALFGSLDPARFPTVVALAEPLNAPDPEGEFAFGLQALLDGIEARIRRASGP